MIMDYDINQQIIIIIRQQIKIIGIPISFLCLHIKNYHRKIYPSVYAEVHK